MPILKGREGEFRAIAQLPAALVWHMLPIFEVVPSGNGSIRDAYRFTNQVRESAPADLTIAVDVRHLTDPTGGARRPLRDIAEDLAAWGIPMLPVLHLYDTAARLADVRHAADLHNGQMILRLGSDTRDPDDGEAEEALERLRNEIGLNIEHCHVVLDVFEVRSERDLTRVEPVVRKCVSCAQRYPWRSVTVAAGAMPQSISQLPVYTPTALRRWDLRLWQRVQDLGIQYADYSIAHPGMGGATWRPMPSLRYSDDEVWWIYRWPRGAIDRHPMYDLCKELVTSDHWPTQGRGFSWGDREIATRADGVGGPGNAANWRAWTTSHHLAQVMDQLGRSGYSDLRSKF
ncbi:beta family protein [Micromonospora sp. NPDC049171]|uniref:beta family protein n=1 Tax=Micromonospora sp. NPDC049171 TaxID=3155770 RepID=UPI00340D4A5D